MQARQRWTSGTAASATENANNNNNGGKMNSKTTTSSTMSPSPATSSSDCSNCHHCSSNKRTAVGGLWKKALLLQQQQQAGIPVVVLYFGLVMAAVCLLVALQSVMHLGSVHPLPAVSPLRGAAVTAGKVATTTLNDNNNANAAAAAAATPLLQNVKNEFYQRYGGETAAMDMLERGVRGLGSQTATAHRMLRAAATQQPFVMAFAGYSVTVGRGNHFHQSFPFVLERILRPPLESLLQTKLIVRNAAIGGIPSFPYAFCLSHFLGDDADVISWDYSMNEGHGANVLEAYIRQGLSQLPKRPMLILLDDNDARIKLLEQYTSDELHNLQPDAMAVNPKKAVDRTMLEQSNPPPGFQQWDEFGAPETCPGRNGWHPKKMEHELMGWMMTMHFIQVLEEVQGIMNSNSDWKTQYAADAAAALIHIDPVIFPPVLVTPPKNDPSVTELLYGHAFATAKGRPEQQLVLKDISCRTSFLPAVDHDKTIPSVVVSGLAPNTLDIMKERPDSLYQQGWVLDVSKIERDTKVKVERCGGLGYIDMKIALYGIPESGPLRLWLPYESQRYHLLYQEHDHNTDANEDAIAKHWFDDLLICEANEKRPAKACQLDEDLEYIVGGVRVEQVTRLDGAGVYLKRPTCVHIGIPRSARVMRLRDVPLPNNAQVLTSEEQRRQLKREGGPGGSSSSKKDQMGLVVEITVKSRVTRQNGACCLSHIVWEQH